MTIETELAQVRGYRWQRRQRHWERWSNFIYPVVRLSGVQRRARWFATRCQLSTPDFEEYCIARWYNHHTARLIERIWTRHRRVRAEANHRHQRRDFRLDGQPFELKIVFPPAYLHGAALQAWLAEPLAALRWYYTQQRSPRFHAAPRLFLVLVDGDNRPERWRRKADLVVLRQAIHQYLAAGTTSYPSIHFRHTSGRSTAPAAEIVCVLFDEVPRVRWWAWAAGGAQVEQTVIDSHDHLQSRSVGAR